MGTSDITADQVLLVTGGYDHSIRFWQAHSAVCYRTLQHTDSQVNAMEVVPDRQTLAAAGFQHIRLYDLNSNNPNPVINCEGISKNVTAVGFHEEGKWMYSGGEDGSCRIWDLRSRNMQCQRLCQISSPVNTAFLHPNQGEIVLGDQNGTIHFWDLRADRSTELLTEKGISIHSVVVDPEGVYLAAVNNKGMCYIWTLSGPAANEGPKAHGKKVFKVHNKYALRCKFSPDSTLLMTTSADCTARIWKTADFSQMSELTTESQRWVWDCAFSTDSQYVITASSDGAARLWSIDGGPPKREYHGHQKPIIALAFRDGETIE